MRRYTIMFMDQQLGRKYLTQVSGDEGAACFDAVDDEAALAYIAQNLNHQIRHCARAELSSMAIVPDATVPGGMRIVDDCLENPYFQDMYVKYDLKTQKLDVDFECTRTVMLTRAAEPSKPIS